MSFLGGTANLLLLATRLDRFAYELRVKKLNLDNEWDEQVKQINSKKWFFKYVSYRPDYGAEFHVEKMLIKAANAVANARYYEGDIPSYIKINKVIGNYLENAKVKSQSDVIGSDEWTDYLHAKATIVHLEGDASLAAIINRESYNLLNVRQGRELDSLSMENCSMCCRIESLSQYEESLLQQINLSAQTLSEKYERIEEETTENQNKLKSVRKDMVYQYLVRCKILMHQNVPNIEELRENVIKAQTYRQQISDEDIDACDLTAIEAAILLYQAFLSKLNCEPLERSKKLYDQFLIKLDSSKANNFCFFKLPQHVLSDLANHVGNRKILTNFATDSNKKEMTMSFVGTLIKSYFVIFILGFVAYKFSLNLQKDWPFISSLVLSGIFLVLAITTYLIKTKNENRFSALISKTAFGVSDGLVALFIASMFTMLSSTHSEFVESKNNEKGMEEVSTEKKSADPN